MVLILPLMPIFELIGCGIQLLVAYLISPKVPITLRTRDSVDDGYLYDKAYIEVLNSETGQGHLARDRSGCLITCSNTLHCCVIHLLILWTMVVIIDSEINTY